jgi:hypothetical protein
MINLKVNKFKDSVLLKLNESCGRNSCFDINLIITIKNKKY